MLAESIKLALGNIERTRLRHFLTMCGIMIGTGAIVSMVSFAVGMRSEMSRTIASSGLLTTIYVVPGGSVLGQFAPGMDEHDPDDFGARSDAASATRAEGDSSAVSARKPAPGDSTREAKITDETIDRIASIRKVTHAFPLVAFPAIVSHGPRQAFAMVTGVPASMADATKKRLEKGELFSSESDNTLLASVTFAEKLGLRADSLDSKSLHAGIPVTLTIVTLGGGLSGSSSASEGARGGARGERSFGEGSPGGASFSPLASLGLLMPFERKSFSLRLTGLLKESFFGPIGRADCYVPLDLAKRMSAMTIQNPSDVLRNPSLGRGGYAGAEVHVATMEDVESVTNELRNWKFTVFSILDQLKGMRTAFVLVSAFLGAIGGVALFVGCLGIVNVMLISVLERTREIGIMKSVGARRRDVMHLFVVEAALIGLVGGLSGVALGWLVAEVTNHLMFAFIIKDQAPYHRLYEIPFWLSCGAACLAIFVSILAGLYPARRAAGLEPTAALRYE